VPPQWHYGIWKNANDSKSSYICLASLGIEALIQLIKEPRKGWHVYILFAVFSTNVNYGNITIVNDVLKNCL
jgi:hypothetical protein